MPAPAVPTPFGRFAHFGVLALTVVVFGIAVAAITWQLRAGLRDQILRREAAWLEAITAMQLAEAADTLGGEPIENVPQALFVAVLKTQKLSWVQPLLASLYSGAFHPTAEGHAAIADAVVEKARAILAKYEARRRPEIGRAPGLMQ